MSTKAVSLIGLVLAASIGISAFVIPGRRISLSLRSSLMVKGTRAIAGRWINGRYLRFEDEVVASNAELAKDARRLDDQGTSQVSSDVAIDRALLALLDAKPIAAAAILQKSLERSPSDGSLLNNFAMVELVKADQGDSASLIAALDALERCLRIQPDLKEALFNRALILERLSLKSSARDTWRAYINLEPQKLWVQVARKHLAYAEEPSSEQSWRTEKYFLQQAVQRGDDRQASALVAKFPQQSRVLIQEEILARWANARLSGNEALAAQQLSTARHISEILLRCNGEASAENAVYEIENAEKRGLGLNLARGYASFEEGLKDYQRFQPQKALGSLLKAQEVFGAAGGPALSLWTDFWLAGTHYYLGQRQIAEAEIDMILRSPEISRYPALRGRALWSLGLMMLVRSELSLSLKKYQAALSEFEKLGEVENIGSVQALIAENFHAIGQENRSWQLRTHALKNLSSFSSSVRLHNILYEAADKLLSSGFPAVAQYFYAEDLQVSRQIGNPATIAETLLGRSRDLFILGYPNSAWADMHEARSRIQEISDVSSRERFQADAALAAGEIADVSTVPGLIRDLSFSIAYYERLRIFPLSALAHLVRAQLLLSISQEAEGELDLKEAIKTHESAVDSIDDLDARISYRNQWQSVFDQVIELEAVRRNNPVAAFNFLEYARSGQWDGGFLSKAVSQRLQPGDVLVEYALLSDKLLVWMLSKGSLHFAVTEIEENRLKSLVNGFTSDLRGATRAGHLMRTSKLLFHVLAQPIVDREPNSNRWILIPDRCLGEIPFAALIDPTSGRYLIEQKTLIYELSAFRWVASSSSISLRVAGKKEKKSRERYLLAVGGPKPELRDYPHLGELRDAASEAQEVANLYSQKMLLLDRQATRANFLRALRQATVVHFAGHAIFASDEPLSSKLILTPGQGSSLGSTISARELAKMDLHHVGLFILSACDTGARGAGRRDGFPGFVDALLGAGVSSVVATQWRMPDQQSRLFFVEFHRIILAGKPADEALRLAQVEAIHGGQSTGFWAALEILGDIQ